MASLDLRELTPPERHAAVHAHLDDLGTGETLELVDAHRPAPLQHELEATRPGEFAWEDGEQGPGVFTARITCTARVVDTRPLIGRGEEPFDTIMAAVGELTASQPLVVRVPFEPVPLEGVLSGQGFTYEAAALAADDWRVVFRPSS